MVGHTNGDTLTAEQNGCVALIGQPNVGKSVVFQLLTGRQAITANYPGTTVEVLRGDARHLPGTTFVDTPGVITLPPRTEDEMATARVLLNEPLKAVVQVADAKNLRRTLLLTVVLAEMGRPFILALNMMDEADVRGVEIDRARLSEYLDLPVVPMVATRKEGIENLQAALLTGRAPHFRLQYPEAVESALAELGPRLPPASIASRALALLWLCGDPVAEEWLTARMDAPGLQFFLDRREGLQLNFVEPISTIVQRTRLAFVEQVADDVSVQTGTGWRGLSLTLGHLAAHPLWGMPILAGVLYALYWFVGVFGAGILVDLLESGLFGQVINPWVAEGLARLIPIPLVVEALVGEYGLWSVGMTYALALILPIVSTFFLAFGLLEDSGYLPRLSVLSNRMFRLMGLNGKAIVPMVLGLGCVTMATMTTRILESKRERLLVILLLALAVPCSAQLGVVMGILASVSFTATLIWSGVVLGVLLAVGWLAARLVPGERSAMLVELPPLRRPIFKTVVVKTIARLEWYLKEVVPLFLLGTALLFVLDKTGVLDVLVRGTEPLVVGWLGLPPEASAAFLMGFLRRDFGATGLFVMEAQGLLAPAQVVVSMVTVTLFVPCVASVFMMAKERGTRTALAITAVIFPLAFLVGGLLYRLLAFIGWGI
jgi:ferrous iron transport protein B